MKKIIIILSFLALSVAFYGIYEAYAAINYTLTTPLTTQPTTPNNWSSPITATKPYPCGDPISDPRPRMVRYPIPI